MLADSRRQSRIEAITPRDAALMTRWEAWSLAPLQSSRTALCRKQADDQNRALARFRARNVINAIQASIGKPGQGIVHPEKEVDEAVDTTSQVRESVSPSEGDDTSVLHPHSDAAKSSDGKATVQREQREKYAFLRRVDLVVNGVLAGALPGR